MSSFVQGPDQYLNYWATSNGSTYMNDGTFRNALVGTATNYRDIMADPTGLNIKCRLYIVMFQQSPPRYYIWSHLLGKNQLMSCKDSLSTPIFVGAFTADETYEITAPIVCRLLFYCPGQDRYLTLTYDAAMGKYGYKPTVDWVAPMSIFTLNRSPGPCLSGSYYQITCRPNYYLNANPDGTVNQVASSIASTRWRFEVVAIRDGMFFYEMVSIYGNALAFNTDDTVSLSMASSPYTEMCLFINWTYAGRYGIQCYATHGQLYYNATSTNLYVWDPNFDSHLNGALLILPV